MVQRAERTVCARSSSQSSLRRASQRCEKKSRDRYQPRRRSTSSSLRLIIHERLDSEAFRWLALQTRLRSIIQRTAREVYTRSSSQSSLRCASQRREEMSRDRNQRRSCWAASSLWLIIHERLDSEA